MKRFIFMTTMAVGSLLFIGATEAEAQNSGRCNPVDNSSDPLQMKIYNDHGSGDGLALHTCTANINGGMEYTFRALGLCNGVPNIAGGLDNCYAVFNEDFNVDITNGNANAATGNPTSGFMPPEGSYTH